MSVVIHICKNSFSMKQVMFLTKIYLKFMFSTFKLLKVRKWKYKQHICVNDISKGNIFQKNIGRHKIIHITFLLLYSLSSLNNLHFFAVQVWKPVITFYTYALYFPKIIELTYLYSVQNYFLIWIVWKICKRYCNPWSHFSTYKAPWDEHCFLCMWSF